MSRRVVALGLAAFVALGLVDGMLGPAWPAIRAQLGQPLAALGELALLGSAGAVVSGLLAARVRSLFGAGGQLAAGAVAGAAALALFAASPWWGGVLGAALLLGVGAAAIDAGFNAQLALYHGPRLTNALHASYGIGATLGPLVVAAALATGSWRAAWIAAAIVWALLAIALRLRRRDFGGAMPERWREVASPSGRGALAVMLALFFLAVGVEAALGAWGATLLLARGWSRAAAAAWVASYWACFTAGRVALAAVGARLAPVLALRASSALLVAALAALLWTPLGLPLAGLGLAAFFPALVSLTPRRLGPDRVPAAVGYQLAAGTLGGTAVVGVAGIAAQWLGSAALAPFLLGTGALLVALELAASASSLRPQPGSAGRPS